MKKKQREKKATICLKLMMAVTFFIGAAVFTYPFLANAISNYWDQQRIASYQQRIAKEKDATQKKILEEYQAKNQELAEEWRFLGMGKVKDPFKQAVKNEKGSQKNLYKEHLIGAIYIPKIKVSLPLFDETNDQLLEKGATVLQGSSFPIGGNETPVSYTHLRAHETDSYLVCRLLLEKKKITKKKQKQYKKKKT